MSIVASIILMLVLIAIAAYLRMKGVVIACAALVGIVLGQVLTWDCTWIHICLYILVILVGLFTTFQPIRRALSDRIFAIFKKVSPRISETEQAAIDSGTVWWDGELFSGLPNYDKLLGYKDSRLTEEEQAYIDLSLIHI